MRVLVLAVTLWLAAAGAEASPMRWVLTPDGLGPLTIGMTVRQARTALGRPLTEGPSGEETCADYAVKGLAGLYLMFENGRLSRVSVTQGGPWRTAAGIGIGDSEAAVRKAYGRLRRKDNAYEDPPAAYLTVRAPHGRGIKFGTDTHRKVTEMEAGGPAIAYIEGCL